MSNTDAILTAATNVAQAQAALNRASAERKAKGLVFATAEEEQAFRDLNRAREAYDRAAGY